MADTNDIKLPDLMNVKELISYLHCSKAVAYELCKRKDFPSFKVGKVFYIDSSKLTDWIEKQTRRDKN